MDRREYEFEGDRPEIHGNAHVSRESTLVGDVRVESNASVWPGAVLRGDVAPVRVGKGSHVTDNVTIHGSEIGDRVLVGNGAVLNDAEIGDNTLVGFNATVNEVTVGDHCIVASGAVTLQGSEVPPRSFVYGSPAQTTPLEETGFDVDGLYERYSTGAYSNLAARHAELFAEED
jgi:carbonic anhydrase/acetyltransferase-like protein (isoleucine patch superfamily)